MKIPGSVMETLEQAAASFSEKPISAVKIKRLDLPRVRRGLHKARRDGQVGAAVYEPRTGDALIVLRADDLAELLSSVERGARK